MKIEGKIVILERLKNYNLSWYVKDDLVNLLEEYPDLFEMSEGELIALHYEMYREAAHLFDRGNRLESDGDAIKKLCEAKFGPKGL